VFLDEPQSFKSNEERRQMTKSTIRVAIDVGSKSHWVGVGLSEGQVLERFSIAHNQKGFEHFFRRVELHRQRLERPVEVAMEGYNGQRSFAGVGRSWPDPPRNRPDAPRTNGAVPPGKSPSRPG
jgi:hypothetical protein